MERKSTQPLEIFYCYARKDHALRDELDVHLAGLRRSGLIRVWHDREISPGAHWEQEIGIHLHRAHIILLLVSPDFLHSDYCYSKEMTRAIERHYANEARVVPVLLRPADWTDTPFSCLQMLPSGARPVTSWLDRDEAFEDIAKGIRRVVDELLSPSPIAFDTPISPTSRKQRSQDTFDKQLQSEQVLIEALPGKGDLCLALGADRKWHFLGQETDEEVKMVTRNYSYRVPSYWIFLGVSISIFICCLLLFPGSVLTYFVSLGTYLSILSCGGYILSTVFGKITYIITNKRVITSQRMLPRATNDEIAIESITQVEVSYELFEILLDQGTLRISLRGSTFIMRNIKNPQQAKNLLQRLLRHRN